LAARPGFSDALILSPPTNDDNVAGHSQHS